MAFLSKVGSLLRQTASKQISSELSASRPSIYQAIRCMSSSKLFIGGLSYQTGDQDLREAFAKYGYVAEARVIIDRESGRSRGFGFVTFNSAEEASSAIQALDGQDLQGRRVRVNYATDRARGGGGGGYGGNYGGQGGYGGGGGGGYGGNYGGNYGNNAYGAPSGNYGGNSGGGGNYGSGGSYSSSYGGGNAGYGGAGNYSSGNSFESGNAGGFSSGSGNYGVAGGAGGIDGGFDGNTGASFGGGNQFGSSDNQIGGFDSNESDSITGASEPSEGNTRDDLDEDGDFAKRA